MSTRYVRASHINARYVRAEMTRYHECDCGARYATRDALMACQDSRHGRSDLIEQSTDKYYTRALMQTEELFDRVVCDLLEIQKRLGKTRRAQVDVLLADLRRIKQEGAL